MEEAGVIQGYGAHINQSAFGKLTPVLVEISLKNHESESFQAFETAMRNCEQVTDCYATGGGIDYILKVDCDNIESYQALVDHWLSSSLGIERYYTYIVTKTVK